MKKIVYVVHCVDAEGPLYENVEAKFERLRDIFGVDGLAATQDNFDRILRGEISLGGKEEYVRRAFSTHLTGYLDSWDKIDAMLARVMSESFRREEVDSFGGGYRFSWFCLDHVGYETNPRRRTMGYLATHDHYREILDRQKGSGDGLHWHFHPMSIYREAHRWGVSLFNSPHIPECLARRVIDRRWFPSCARAGCVTERPDIHWFLEQYIPFDFSNTSLENDEELQAQADLADGRSADWRRAPRDWSVYHPSHDDYQVPGQCRRWITRSLTIMNRMGSIDEAEVHKAFSRADRGQPTLLAVTSHDFRDLAPEVRQVRELIVRVQHRFPDVRFKFCEAREAVRAVACGAPREPALQLRLDVRRDARGRPHVLTISTVAGRVFGPQPFFTVKTRSQRYIHDNLDFSLDGRSWRYVFDADSIHPADVEAMGVGANDAYGNTVVEVVGGEMDRSGTAERPARAMNQERQGCVPIALGSV